ncbi:hypothetical protein [Haloarcula rubripromontorii]|uniref:DUF8055 domain-containing protein n=1 Tax=Haloarcula rubripromontorii TaxID=1705562 RepID=A0A0M9AL63_9EURY|nr:hypothetical protein [Haloarcula rubripromontorii]KOX94297.1 hypothetical protein AMS69_00075 [Haloarcula rubripromontorii]NLV07230.1 hypothetical protein [Haloarcula rubripromontorii]
MTSGQYHDRVQTLSRRAETVRKSLDPNPPDEERAMEVLRDGFGPTVALYCEARTGSRWVRFSESEFERLEGAMNDWLDCYAACYGVELAGTYGIREAAELLVDTHNARDVAQVLTGVPGR